MNKTYPTKYAGEVAKEGMENVKEAMESAMVTAENSIGAMVGKVSNTLSSTKNNVTESVEGFQSATEDVVNKTADGMTEVVSEAETVLVSETENAKETIKTTTAMAFDKMDNVKDEFGEAIKEVKENMHDSLHIEDVEQSIDSIDSNYKDMKKKAENIVNGLPTPATTPPPEVEDKKEEPAPTLWEAAADAILHQRIRPSIDIPDSDMEPTISDSETNHGTELDTDYDPESDSELLEKPEGYINKEFIRPPEIIINSETLSVKSYKSEI